MQFLSVIFSIWASVSSFVLILQAETEMDHQMLRRYQVDKSHVLETFALIPAMVDV